MILPNNKGMWDTNPPHLIGPQRDKKIGGENLHVAVYTKQDRFVGVVAK